MNVFVDEVNNTVEIVDEPEIVVVTVPTITTVNIVDIGPQGPKGDTGPQGPSGSGMPSEGLTGQVLAKKSNASFDLEWITVDVDVSALVPKTTTVNGKALSSNITLSTADVSDSSNKRYVTDADLVKLSNTSGVNTGDQDLSGYVPTSRTVNGQALSSNVSLTTAQIADSVDKRYVTDSDLTKLGNTSGTNTGDQNLFSRVSVAGQSDIVADSSADTLTLIGGTNIGITTNAINDSITISAIGGGDVVGPSSSIDNAIVKYDGTTGKLIQNTGSLLTDSGELQTLGGALEYVKFDSTPTAQTPVDGLVIYDSAEGTLDLTLAGANSSVKIGEQQFLRIYNDSGATLNRGEVVYISGAQGNRVAVKLARADAEATAKDTLGIVDETITVGSEGWILVSGVMRRLNTSSFTAGSTVFLSTTTAGAFSATKPVAPNHLVVIGFVARVHATVGSIYVKIDNGYEIDELHDVKITGTPAAGSLLVRDATEGVWENVTLTAGSHISVTNADASITVGVSGAGSANGLATLDAGGKVPANQLPSSLMDYRGVWNASTNTPSLADGVGSAGDVYRVSVAGTQNLGSGSLSYEVGDYVIYNGTVWEKSDTTDAVASVNLKTGVVVLNPDDLDDTSTTHKFTSASDISRLANTSGTNTGDQDLSGLVTKTTTVNGQALSSNVTLTTANIADSLNKRYVTDGDLTKLSNTSGTNTGDQDLSGLVTKTTTINGKALSANVTLTTADIADSLDKRYVTDADLTKLSNTSGTNSGDQSLFSSIAVAGQSTVTADSTSDTLTLVGGTNIAITTNATTDTVTISAVGGGDVVGPASSVNNNVALFDGVSGKLLKDSGLTLSGSNTGDQNIFSTVAVAGQSNVVPDSTSDTLTLVAGSNVTITTDASTDTITIASTGGGVAPSISEGRLTISNTVSLPQGGGSVTKPSLTPDVDADNSSGILYYTPYVGNRIAMYDGTRWNLEVIPSITSMTLTGAGPNETFDVFGWMNGGSGGTFNIERLSWGTNTAYNISAVTVGANTVITFTEPGGTQPFAVGDVVEVQNTNGTAGATLHGAWCVTAVGGSGTSRSVTLGYVITTGLTYTGGGTIRKNRNTRTTGLAVQDGVYVKSGDATRKYLGTFRTTGAGALTIDNRQSRLVWNYYNRRPRSLFRTETTSTWFFAGEFRAANANAANRVEIVTGVNEDPVKIDMTGCFRGPVPSTSGVIFQSTQNIGLGINRSDQNNLPLTGLNFLMQMNRVVGDSWVAPNYSTLNTGFAGYNFLTWVEYAWTNQAGLTVEIFGFSNGVRASGILGTIHG